MDFKQKILSLLYFYQGGIQYKDILDMNYKEIFELLEETEELNNTIEKNINKASKRK